ncbi:MAG: HlyD family efflux transporter periplasmic adaptor subunit [Gammaproteobacteria bacterium]|nr:HlyD family efflux transporter periplasmic adaptor subunit [Gammaproteobacteria bacterium]
MATVCQMLPGVDKGLVVLSAINGQTMNPVAWPDIESIDSDQLAIAQHAMSTGARDLQSHAARSGKFIDYSYPIVINNNAFAVAVFRVAGVNEAQQVAFTQLLAWSVVWLEILLNNQSGRTTELSNKVVAVLMASLQHESLLLSVNAGINEIVQQFDCDRASIGLLQGKSIEVLAVSGMAHFDRRSNLVKDIRTAMHESSMLGRMYCYQPAQPVDDSPAAHARLAATHARHDVCSFPLYVQQKPVGAVVLEMSGAGNSALPDSEVCEQLGRLLGAVLDIQKHRDMSWAGRLKVKLAHYAGRLAASGEYKFKAGVVFSLLLLTILILGSGEYRIASDARLEGRIQQAIVSPYDGFISASYSRAGNAVQAGQVMAELDNQELQLEAAELAGRIQQLSRQHRKSLVEGDRAQVNIHNAEIEQAKAEQKLVAMHLSRTRLLAPFDGIVVTGDLSRSLGAPIERGQVLFEIAPLNQYRVVLSVDERDIRYIKTGQSGSLTLYAMAGDPVPFTVTNISTVAGPERDYVNFLVEASIDGPVDHLRPGMQGTGKISVGDHKLIWIWTRRMVDWLKIRLWLLLP